MDSPSRGPTLVEAFWDGSGLAFWGLVMDPSIACDKSFLPLDANDLQFVLVHGSSGVADIGTSDFMGVVVDVTVTGDLKMLWAKEGETDFGYSLPPEMRSKVRHSEVDMAVNNRELLSLLLIDRTPSLKHQVVVLRKRDKTWHRVTIPSERLNWQRGFGSFIAFAEARAKDPQHTESAGRAEWRQTESKMGPSVQARFEKADVIFPGLLYIYNIETEKALTITTNQGDSEVLLIANSIVYYRASDRLYSAPITGDGIGEAKLLATDEAIRDVHWAFIKP